MDLDTLIREADPTRNLIIPEPDKAHARHVCETPPRSPSRVFGAFWGGVAVAMAVAIAVIALVLVGNRRGSPSSSPSAASVVAAARPLTSILGVLRRPQTAADRAVEAEVRKLQGGAIDLPLVRLAAVTPWGEQVILAPVRASPNDTLGMFDADPKGTPAGGVSCGCGITPAFIEGGRGWSLEGAGRNFAGGSTGFRLFIVVPDGVAKVTFVLPRQRVHSSAPGRPVDRYPLAVSAPVHDNVAFVQVLNRACCDGSFVTRWYAADGRLIEVAGSRSGANRIVAPPAPARTHRASPVILRTFGVLRIRRASPSPAHHFRQSVG